MRDPARYGALRYTFGRAARRSGLCRSCEEDQT